MAFPYVTNRMRIDSDVTRTVQEPCIFQMRRKQIKGLGVKLYSDSGIDETSNDQAGYDKDTNSVFGAVSENESK